MDLTRLKRIYRNIESMSRAWWIFYKGFRMTGVGRRRSADDATKSLVALINVQRAVRGVRR